MVSLIRIGMRNGDLINRDVACIGDVISEAAQKVIEIPSYDRLLPLTKMVCYGAGSPHVYDTVI